MPCATPILAAASLGASEIELSESVNVTSIWADAGDGDPCDQTLSVAARLLPAGAPFTIGPPVGPAAPATPYLQSWMPGASGTYEVWAYVQWNAATGWPLTDLDGPGVNGPNDPPIAPAVTLVVNPPPIVDPHVRTRPEAAAGTASTGAVEGAVGAASSSGEAVAQSPDATAQAGSVAPNGEVGQTAVSTGPSGASGGGGVGSVDVAAPIDESSATTKPQSPEG